MRKSPFAELLNVFTPEERSEFLLFVESPFFNRGEFRAESPRLLRYLYDTPLDSYWQEEGQRSAFAAVFSQADFVEGKLEKVMSVLHRLARSFVSVQARQGKHGEFDRLLDLAVFSRHRGLDSRFENTVQAMREEQKRNYSGEDLQFFYRRLAVELEQHEYENMLNRKRGDVNIPRTIEALDVYYHALKLNLLNRYMMQEKVTHLETGEYMQWTLEESHVPPRLLEDAAFLRLAEAFLKVLKMPRPEKGDFHLLSDLMRRQEGEIDVELLKDYYSFLRSCCSILVNSGQHDYLPVLFHLQKDHLERGFFYYNQKITPSTFQNIIIVALRLKEFDWAYDCIQAHAGRIVGDNESGDYFHFNLANYFFFTGQYDAALNVLPQSLAEVEYQMMAKRLELKIYYCMGSDLLAYKIDSFKMFISRSFLKPLSPLLKEGNGNFVNLLGQLCNIPNGDTARIERLLSRVGSKTWLFDRDWLIEQANALK